MCVCVKYPTLFSNVMPRWFPRCFFFFFIIIRATIHNSTLLLLLLLLFNLSNGLIVETKRKNIKRCAIETLVTVMHSMSSDRSKKNFFFSILYVRYFLFISFSITFRAQLNIFPIYFICLVFLRQYQLYDVSTISTKSVNVYTFLEYKL